MSSQDFKQWYENNKDEYNAKRRQKYAENPEVRSKAIARSQRYKGRRDSTKTYVVKVIDGKQIHMYPTGSAAKIIGVHHNTIPNWEKRGLIPEPILREHRRFYTSHQLSQMVVLKNLLERANKSEEYAVEKAALVEMIKTTWRFGI